MCRLCHLEIEDEEHFTSRYPTYSGIRENYEDILGPSPTLSQVFNTSNVNKGYFSSIVTMSNLGPTLSILLEFPQFRSAFGASIVCTQLLQCAII